MCVCTTEVLMSVTVCVNQSTTPHRGRGEYTHSYQYKTRKATSSHRQASSHRHTSTSTTTTQNGVHNLWALTSIQPRDCVCDLSVCVSCVTTSRAMPDATHTRRPSRRLVYTDRQRNPSSPSRGSPPSPVCRVLSRAHRPLRAPPSPAGRLLRRRRRITCARA